MGRGVVLWLNISELFIFPCTQKTPPIILVLSKLELHIEVARIYFYVTGFRGDWKALKQVFNLTKHYSTDKVWFQNVSKQYKF